MELENVIFHEIPRSAVVGRVSVPDELPSLVGDGVLVSRATP
ncbi:MAG TPA: hypothetical protein VMZ71_12690 [Gemmataceae bacterium]|nr:hypothetical protein [Gemmataceae bacterium]